MSSNDTELFFRTLFKDSFTEAPKTREERTLKSCKGNANSLGFSHFGYVDVSYKKGKTVKKLTKCTVFRTFQTLFGHLGEPTLLWYTPNTLSTSKAYGIKSYYRVNDSGGLDKIDIFDIDVKTIDSLKPYDPATSELNETVYIIKGGRKEQYVRWLNALTIDIDSKLISRDQLLHKIRVLGLPEPTVINETTNGYHVYWFLKRVPATPNAKKLYTKILKKMIVSLAKDIEKVDKKTIDTCRYFQVPRNIIFSSYENTYNLAVFKNWFNATYQFDKSERIQTYDKSKNSYSGFVGGADNLEKAINIILKGVKRGERHNAAFALSCYFKFKKYDKSKTLRILLEWNNRNEDAQLDHGQDDIIRTVESVYASVSENGVVGIPTELISDLSGIVVPKGFYKFKKERNERTYSHYKEWVQDILTCLIKAKNKTMYGSQEKLSSRFGMCISSFKTVLKMLREGNFKFLIFSTTGKGCAAQSIISLNEIFINKNKSPFYIEYLIEMLMDEKPYKVRVSGDTIYLHSDPPF